jgi:two-component system OmpR family response regulator
MAFVVFVEDEANIGGYIREIERRGHMVQRYYAGYDLLQEVTDGLEYDVAFIDRSLPDIEGDTLISLLKRQLPDKQIVCMSGYLQNDLFEKSAQAPYDHYLVKGSGHDRFLAILDKLLPKET